jgi:hypothetical protein
VDVACNLLLKEVFDIKWVYPNIGKRREELNGEQPGAVAC